MAKNQESPSSQYLKDLGTRIQTIGQEIKYMLQINYKVTPEYNNPEALMKKMESVTRELISIETEINQLEKNSMTIES